METIDLSSADYWESDSIDLRLNPKRPVQSEGVTAFLQNEVGICSAVVIPTSGSSGEAKFVILSKHAILASARAVNLHCGIQKNDRWLGGLSTFHVGGLGIYARAYCNGAEVVPMPWENWRRDGGPLLDAITATGATLTSLTPVHLCDLVRAGAVAPESLRMVFLGGGRVDRNLVDRARSLGWPLRVTYGMSEAASQIATSQGDETDRLPILANWECREGPDARLQIRGEALFSGYARREGERWIYVPSQNDKGWFTTEDRCEVSDGTLRFIGRADDAVKVFGELVSLSGLQTRLDILGITGVILAVPEERRGNELVLVVEGDGKAARDQLNINLPFVEQVSRVISMSELPRTDLGKLDLAAIRKVITGEPSTSPSPPAEPRPAHADPETKGSDASGLR